MCRCYQITKKRAVHLYGIFGWLYKYILSFCFLCKHIPVDKSHALNILLHIFQKVLKKIRNNLNSSFSDTKHDEFQVTGHPVQILNKG